MIACYISHCPEKLDFAPVKTCSYNCISYQNEILELWYESKRDGQYTSIFVSRSYERDWVKSGLCQIGSLI